MSRKQMSDEHKEKVQAALAAARNKKRNVVSISLGPNTRIHPVDKYNWALQRKAAQDEEGNDLWASKSYWPTLKDALDGVSTKLIDDELRKASVIESAGGLVKIIDAAKSSVLAKLNNLAEGIDDSPYEDDEEEEEAV